MTRPPPKENPPAAGTAQGARGVSAENASIIAHPPADDKRLRTAFAELALVGIEAREVEAGVYWLRDYRGPTLALIHGPAELIRRAPQYLDARREALRVLGRGVQP